MRRAAIGSSLHKGFGARATVLADRVLFARAAAVGANMLLAAHGDKPMGRLRALWVGRHARAGH